MTSQDMPSNDEPVRCFFCSQMIGRTPKLRQLRRHKGLDGHRCPGSGLYPNVAIASTVPRKVRFVDRRIVRAAFVFVFTIVAGTVGILGWLGIQPGGVSRESDSLVPGRVALAPDPYLFVGFDQAPPARSQDCVGLLGLCLGQPIGLAIQDFGASEAVGYPRQSYYDQSELCHGWHPSRFEEIIVCERSDSISKFELWFSPDAAFSITLPGIRALYLPKALALVGKDIDMSGASRRSARVYQDEGYDMFWRSWYLVEPKEGVPIAMLHVSGRLGWGANYQGPVPSCDYPAFDAVASSVASRTIIVSDLVGEAYMDDKRCN